ncbi:MAG: AEC family transporter [Gammaproteobacteria bacterium]
MSLLLLALGFTAGLLMRRTKLNHPLAPDLINGTIINFALPAMILLRVPALDLTPEALTPVFLAWGVIATTALMVWTLSRRLQWSREVTGALLLVVPLSNSAYLGLPLISAIASDEIVGYAILYDQIGNFMAVAIYASVVIALLSRQAETPTVGSVVRRIVLFPPFLVTVLALLIRPDMLPGWAIGPLTLLGATMGPLAMLIVGLQLEWALPAALRQPLAIGASIKLVGAPLIATAAAMLIGSASAAGQASVLQAAMPSMITAGLLGIAAGFSRTLIVAMIGLTTLASALSLPLVFWRVLGSF